MPQLRIDFQRFARMLVRAATIGSAAFLLLWPASVQGQTSTWQLAPQTSGDWFTAGNWNGGVPTASRIALIDNGGTTLLNSGSAATSSLRVGFNGSGYMEQLGGEIDIGFGPSVLGQSVGSFGKYRIHDGLFTVARSLGIGVQGTGEFVQFGGSVRLEGDFHKLGTTVTGNGTYRLADGTFYVEQELAVGDFGEGLFVHSGGESNVGTLTIGRIQSGTGKYELIGGTLTTGSTNLGPGASHFVHGAAKHTTVSLDVGQSGGADGSTAVYDMTDDASELSVAGLRVGGRTDATFNQLAGTTEVSGKLSVHSTKTADYNLQGGTLTSQYVTIGGNGDGTFNQSGGSFTVTGDIRLGESSVAPASTGRFNLSGGTFVAEDDAYVGHSRNGEFAQTGGSAHVKGDLIVGYGAGARYAIDDGSLLVDGDLRVGTQSSYAKTFEINGGLGQIDVGGDFILGPFGGQPLNRPVVALNFDSTGISPIDAEGLAQIDGGRFFFTFAPDFAPTLGQEFLLISADEGIFGNPIYSGLGTLGEQWDIVRTANTLTLVSLVPEPGTMVLASLGGVALLIAARRCERGNVGLTVLGSNR